MKLAGLEVIIIGAGVAGLAAARALRREGAGVLVLEQAEALREFGAGVQISPNGARVLQALGLDAGLRRAALPSQGVVLRHGASGRQVLRLDLPQEGPGFHLMHRADLIALLAQGLDSGPHGAQLRFDARVTKLHIAGPRPTVTLQDGSTLQADLILGADGLHSVLRRAILPQAAQPFFTGQVAWRALIPGDGAANEAQVFMGPGRHLVSYPLRAGTLRNIVAVEERRDWVVEGWNHPDDPAHLRAAFGGFSGPVPAWLEQVESCYLWGLFRHPVAVNWWQGHAALLGDAAHPTLPFMAQGANLALEDAWVLAAELMRAPGAAALPQALAAYQQRRDRRARQVVGAANRNARNYHLRPPLDRVAHAVLRLGAALRHDAALQRFRWIYDHDVTQP